MTKRPRHRVSQFVGVLVIGLLAVSGAQILVAPPTATAQAGPKATVPTAPGMKPYRSNGPVPPCVFWKKPVRR